MFADNFKHATIKILMGVANFLSVIALIAAVVAMLGAIAYEQIPVIAQAFGIEQGELGWLAASLGSLGIFGGITLKVSTGLKAMLNMSDAQHKLNMNAQQDQFNTALKHMQEKHDVEIAQLKQHSISRDDAVAKHLEAQEKFNTAQAYKYVQTPDRLINKETKDKYQEYLDTVKKNRG